MFNFPLAKVNDIPPILDPLLGLFILATFILLLLSLTSYQKQNHLIDNTTHFKLQYLLISIFLFCFFLLTQDWILCLVNLVTTFINLTYIVPWYLHRPQVSLDSLQKIRIFQCNLEHNNQQYSWIINQVREENPDIIVFLEMTKTLIKELKVLEKDYCYSVFHLEPYHIKPPLWYVEEKTISLGIAIYSKLPLENTSIENLGGGRKTVVVRVFEKNLSFFLLATHPSFPFRKSTFKIRNQQLQKIGNYIKNLSESVIVVGDLNISMWSPYYKEFVQETQLRNTRQGFGILPSFSIFKSIGTSLPFFRNPHHFLDIIPSFATDIPVDHCLVSQEIRVLNARLGKKVGSDHLPLIADLVFPDLEISS